MLYEYGKAVVKERTQPREHAELSRYLRLEYGPETGPAYFLANGAQRKSRKGRWTPRLSRKLFGKPDRALAADGGR